MKKQPNSSYSFVDVSKTIIRAKKIVRLYNLDKKLPEQIRCARLNLLTELVFYYARNWEDYQKKHKVPPTYLLPMRCNRKQLKIITGLGESTIFENLQFLQDAGMLHKVFKGRELGFDIYINPQLLHLSEAVDKLVDKTPVPGEEGLFYIIPKNQKSLSFVSLDTYVQSLTYSKPKRLLETNNSNVDMCISAESKQKNKESFPAKFASSSDFANFGSETQGKQGTESGVSFKKSKEGGRDFEKQSEPQTPKNQKYSNIPTEHLEKLEQFSQELWRYARKTIYTHFKSYTEDVEQNILNTILDYTISEWYYKYRAYGINIGAYYVECCSRLDITYQYVHSKNAINTRFVVSPQSYFDYKNQVSGFRCTKKIYENRKVEKQEDKAEYLLKRADKAFKTRKLYKNVEKSIIEIYEHFRILIEKQSLQKYKEAYYMLAKRYVSSHHYNHL